MCFSENQSYVNFAILASYGSYLISLSDPNIWRIYVGLIYLSLKDLLQGILYRIVKHKDEAMLALGNVPALLSWMHICFQPLVLAIMASYFSPTYRIGGIKYWPIALFGLFLFGLFKLTDLDAFDVIKDRPYCTDPASDYCELNNGAYLGKYHIGYQFHTKDKFQWIWYAFLIPLIITPSWFIPILLGSFSYIPWYLFSDVRDGESGAIWCFTVIGCALFVAYFRKTLLQLARITNFEG